MPDAGFLCILPFRGAAGGPNRAGSAAVQAQTAQKPLPGGILGRGLALTAAGSAGPVCLLMGALAALAPLLCWLVRTCRLTHQIGGYHPRTSPVVLPAPYCEYFLVKKGRGDTPGGACRRSHAVQRQFTHRDFCGPLWPCWLVSRPFGGLAHLPVLHCL